MVARIEFCDKYGISMCAEVSGEHVEIGHDPHGTDYGYREIVLDTNGQRTLLTFLFAAIGPDAAREALAKIAPDIFEAAQWYAKAEELSVEQTRLALAHLDKRITAEARAEVAEASAGQAFAEADAMRARAERAEKRLERVLALTDEDISRAICEGEERAAERARAKGKAIWRGAERSAAVTEVVTLIRSSANEGADEPTGATT